jgi:hypothetical protein
LFVHVGHAFCELFKQFIGSQFCQFGGNEVADGSALAQLQEHEDAFGGSPISGGSVVLHDIGVIQFAHDCDFLEFSLRQAVEVGPRDLFDGNESLLFVIVSLVDDSEGAAAQAQETVVEESLGDLRVAS